MRLNQVRSPRGAEKPAPSIAERSLPRGCAWTQPKLRSCRVTAFSLVVTSVCLSSPKTQPRARQPLQHPWRPTGRRPKRKARQEGVPVAKELGPRQLPRKPRKSVRRPGTLGKESESSAGPARGKSSGGCEAALANEHRPERPFPAGALRSRRGLTMASPFPPRLPAGALALDTRSAPRTGQPFVCSCCPAPGTPRGRGRGFPAQGPASQAQHRPGGVRASPERQL